MSHACFRCGFATPAPEGGIVSGVPTMSVKCVIYDPNNGDVLAPGVRVVLVAVHPRNAQVRVNVSDMMGGSQSVGPSPASGGLWSGSFNFSPNRYYFIGASASYNGSSDSHVIQVSTSAGFRGGKDGDKKKDRRRKQKREKRPTEKPAA
jgi:hypothetical protein